MNNKLIELTPEEAKHRRIWISRDGKIYTLEDDYDSGGFIAEIAEEIVKEKNLKCNCGVTALFFLLSLGYIYRDLFFGWDWYGFSINEQQLKVAKEIDYNYTIKILVRHYFSR